MRRSKLSGRLAQRLNEDAGCEKDIICSITCLFINFLQRYLGVMMNQPCLVPKLPSSVARLRSSKKGTVFHIRHCEAVPEFVRDSLLVRLFQGCSLSHIIVEDTVALLE